MPIARVDLLKGRPAAHHAAIAEGVYQALLTAFKVPEGDKFVLIHEHEPSTLQFSRDYLGIARTDDCVFVQITANAGRTVEQKKALYAAIAENLAADPGLRKEDVVVNVVEVSPADWSFGNGLASYVKD